MSDVLYPWAWLDDQIVIGGEPTPMLGKLIEAYRSLIAADDRNATFYDDL